MRVYYEVVDVYGEQAIERAVLRFLEHAVRHHEGYEETSRYYREAVQQFCLRHGRLRLLRMLRTLGDGEAPWELRFHQAVKVLDNTLSPVDPYVNQPRKSGA
jgi:hypothetical protein